MTQKPLIFLSGGALPTEDIYFFKSAAPFFSKKNKLLIDRIDCTNSLILPSCLLSRKYSSAHLVVVRSLPKRWLIFIENNKHFFSNITYLIDDDFSVAGFKNASDYLPEDYVNRIEKSFLIQDRLFNLADTVVTPCNFLKLKISAFHNNVQLLPPIYINEYPTLEHFKLKTNKIIYPGTRSHLVDIKSIAAVISKVADNQNHTSDFQVSLMLGRHLPASLNGKSFIRNYKPLTWNKFLRFQAANKFHIGLAPLMETPFNKGKSYNKFLDITAFGGVGVFSDRDPYQGIVQDGINGLLSDDSHQMWEESIHRLIFYPKDTYRMAKAAQDLTKQISNPRICYNFWESLHF